MNNFNQNQIGKYRPIYLWGGPGTIRMNKLKFMNVKNDVPVHMDAHQLAGAQVVVDDLSCNWVHLMYDWGFPPEIEEEDWESFRQGANVYHSLGHKVFAYIQTSNCVYQGTYKEKEWYVRNSTGEITHYFTFDQRYMVCLNNPEWQDNLKRLIDGAAARGADGIFFDNIFQGEQPMSMFNTWIGSTGCHCEYCQQDFYDLTGNFIPKSMNQPDPQLQEYLEFRSGQVTRLIRMMRDHIQEIKPGTPISCNDFDPILRNSYLTYGIDLTELAKVQDVVMIENFGLPKWTTIPKPRLANNALTVRSARTLVKENAHLSVLSYDVGIGYDPVYSSRKFQQGIGEAAALGVTMTTKGTEYHDGQQMTLLTDRQYSDRHQAIGNYHRWLETHSDLYSNRKNHSPVGLVFPGKELWYRWHDLALDYFDVGQTLTYHGIPWQVIDPKTEINPAVNTLILVSGDSTAQIPSDFKGKIIYLNQLPAWGKHHSSRLTPDNWEFSLLTRGIKLGMNAYTVNRFSRWLFDKLNLPKIVTQSQFYLLPPQDKQSELLVQLPANMQPRVISKDPVLIDYWNQDGNLQIHLVNYADSAQSIQVLLPWDGKSILITPDADGVMTFDSNPVTINLEIYAIISPE